MGKTLQAKRIRRAVEEIGSQKVGDVYDHLITKYKMPPTRAEIVMQIRIIRGEG